MASFKKINKNINLNHFQFMNIYENKIININKSAEIKNEIQKNKINDGKYNKLFDFFKYELSSKNHILNQYKVNKNVDLLIEKIFLFGIKYYNCDLKLNKLCIEIQSFNQEEAKIFINKIKKLENYKLFYSFYEESSRMKSIYHTHKNKFEPSKFEEEEKNYF